MTIGRIVSTTVYGITSQELHATLDELLENAKELKTSIGELDRSIEELDRSIYRLDDSMEERVRSSELLERQMKESLRFKIFNGNSQSDTMQDRQENMKEATDTTPETIVSKFFSFMTNIWNFFTFNSEE